VSPQPLDFAEFYRRSASECLRTVLASVGDQHTAQELVDEAFAMPFRFTAARGGSTFQMTLRWLPPTAANLAKLNVPIPAGFTQVPPPGKASS
jgi:hypothetical protein